jgi:hypothetical protein
MQTRVHLFTVIVNCLKSISDSFCVKKQVLPMYFSRNFYTFNELEHFSFD